ncbi:hypothetical protein BV22DRAFT_1192376 [Leucogyrophana mollusca]|uniref:Uncharacterized protein n=1 Tax=Leucogyrophana mollusca TaxID=85980 RepID=A0ACB8BTN5_9AGAM|nr:hypothetical protein BV22DRAFT_1192376 [Leucogyrophana mollusca]
MLSSFIRNANGRRKGKKAKLDVPLRQVRSPPSPASFASPEIFDINERSLDLQTRGDSSSEQPNLFPETHLVPPSEPRKDVISPQVQLDLSPEPLTDWFQDFLGGTGNSPTLEGSMSGGNASNSGAPVAASEDTHVSGPADSSWKAVIVSSVDDQGDEAVEAVADSSIDDIVSRNLMVLRVHGPFTSKKSVPAPIKIPQVERTGPNVQIGQSTSTAEPPSRLEAPPPLGAASASHQPSPISSEDMSAVSGTTLARALIANSFVLSSSDHRSSRYRSGMTRQDSATLPRGDHPLVNSPYWRDRRISGGEIVLASESRRESLIPPVPPVPTAGMVFVDQKQARRASRGADIAQRHSDSDLKRSTSISSSTSDIPSVSQYATSPEVPTQTGISRRISRISEVPSPVPTTPHSPQSALNHPSKSGSSIAVHSSLVRADESEESVVPNTASEMPTTASSHRTGESSTSSPRPSQSGLHSPSPTDHSLDEYQFMAPGPPQSAASLGSESSASFSSHVRTKRSDSSLKRRKVGKIAGTTVSSPVGRTYIEFSRNISGDPGSQRNRKQVRLLPIGEPPQSILVPQTPITPAIISSAAPSRYSSLSNFPLVPSSAVPAGTFEMPLTSRDELDSVMVPVTTGIFARQRLGGVPRRLAVAQDPYGLLEYSIAVSPDSHSSSNYTPSSSSAGYQTFPETPVAFTPLWSPDMSRQMIPALRRSNEHASARDGVRQAPRSATIPGPRDLARLQQGVAQRASLSRSMTLNLPKREEPILEDGTPSLRRPQSVFSPSSEVLSPHNIALPPSSASSASSTPAPVLLSRPTSSGGHRRAVSHDSVILSSPVGSNSPSPLSRVSTPGQPSQEEQPLHSFVPALTSPIPSIVTPTEPTPPAVTTPPASINDRCMSPTSIPLPESKSTSPLLPFNRSGSTSPLPALQVDAIQSNPSPPPSEPAEASIDLLDVQAQPHSGTRPTASPHPVSFLPSPSPSSPASPTYSRSSTPSSPSLPPSPATSSPSFTPSFVAPPPYHAVVSSDRENNHMSVSHPPATSNPPREPPPEPSYSLPRERQPSAVSLARSRVRSRPPLPIGPRKPSGPVQPLGSFVPGARDRNGSVSSVGSNVIVGRGLESSPWRKLYSAASSPPPKFQTPPPKWRGLTLDAAQWTFTSNQLQSTVSRAIKHSAEASSIRLLPLETLDNDIPEEMHRLEMQRTDIKSRYKLLVRKRWNLMGSLAGHIDDPETSDTLSAIRTMDELSEVSLALDQLTDELHGVAEQISQLKSLRDVHSASALAMALRKLNTSFLKQATETQMLRQQVMSLEAERDEAWKQAEDVAQDFDDLNDRVAPGDSQSPDSEKSKTSNRRSLRVLARRKSSIRASKAGLRTAVHHRSQRSSVSSGTGARASLTSPASSGIKSSYSADDIPPVPPLPLHTPLGIVPSSLSGRSSMGMSSGNSASSSARALAQAQRELYEMLGIPVHDSTSDSPSRPRSLSGTYGSNHASLHLRPMSDVGGSVIRPNAHGNRAIHGVLSDDRQAMLAALGIMTD